MLCLKTWKGSLVVYYHFSTIQQPLGYTTHFWTQLQLAHGEFLNLRGPQFRGHINLHHD